MPQQLLPEEAEDDTSEDRTPPTVTLGDPTDSDDSEQETAVAASDRGFRCLDCATVTETFLGGCPNCGGNSFETGSPSEPDDTDRSDDLLSMVATATAPFNPYIPR